MADTAAPRQVGTSTRLAYGVGTMAFAAKDAAVVNFLPFYYTQVAGLPGTHYGIAAFIGQLSDAITDPIFGTLSDNHRSRWGRRHPFMVAAIIPLALCFLAMFAPPSGMGHVGLLIWLTLVLVGLRTFLTMFMIPHTALGAELSADYEERTLIASYRTGLGWLAGVGLPTVGLLYLFSRSDAGDGRLVADNYVLYGQISAVLAAVTIAASVWFTRHEIPHLPVPLERRKLRLLDPLRDVAESLQNRNFRWVFISLILMGLGTGVSVTLGFYANTYFWEFSAQQMGLINFSSVVPTAAGFALLRPLTARYEKKSILLTCMLLVSSTGFWWIGGRLAGILPENGSNTLYAMAFLHQFVLVCGVMMMQTLAASMIADIVDEHEVQTGNRKEGVFFAAMGFSQKIPSGLGQAVGGFLISLVGLESGAQPGSVPADILVNLGWVAGPLVATFILGSFACLLPFHLDRARLTQLQAELAQRRAHPGE